jgi:hypothetical protein
MLGAARTLVGHRDASIAARVPNAVGRHST